MSWGAVIGGIGSIAGAAISANAQKKASKSGGSTGNVNIAEGKGIEGIDLLFKNLLAGNEDFSKNMAIADTQGQVNELFRTYANTSLPQIYQAENTSGGYNSATGQMMANDAFAQTVAKAQAQQLDTIKTYRALQQGDFSTLAQLVGSIKGTNPAVNAQAAAARGELLGGLAGSAISGLGTIFGGDQGPQNDDALGAFIAGLGV